MLACSAMVCSFSTHCSVPEMHGRPSISIFLPPLSELNINTKFQVGTCSFASVQVSQWAKACQSPGAGPCGQFFSIPSFHLLVFRLCCLHGFGAAPYIPGSLSLFQIMFLLLKQLAVTVALSWFEKCDPSISYSAISCNKSGKYALESLQEKLPKNQFLQR